MISRGDAGATHDTVLWKSWPAIELTDTFVGAPGKHFDGYLQVTRMFMNLMKNLLDHNIMTYKYVAELEEETADCPDGPMDTAEQEYSAPAVTLSWTDTSEDGTICDTASTVEETHVTLY